MTEWAGMTWMVEKPNGVRWWLEHDRVTGWHWVRYDMGAPAETTRGWQTTDEARKDRP